MSIFWFTILGFFIGTSIFKTQSYFVSILGELPWQIISFGSIAIPIYALCIIVFHYHQGWNSHPIVTKLKLFENERNSSWIAVQNEINMEYKQWVFMNRFYLHNTSVASSSLLCCIFIFTDRKKLVCTAVIE